MAPSSPELIKSIGVHGQVEMVALTNGWDNLLVEVVGELGVGNTITFYCRGEGLTTDYLNTVEVIVNSAGQPLTFDIVSVETLGDGLFSFGGFVERDLKDGEEVTISVNGILSAPMQVSVQE